MTRKFLILVAVGLPIVCILAFIGAEMALAGFLLYHAACLGLLFIDMVLSPGEKAFIVERQPEDKLYFKTENTIGFNVRNKYHRPLRIELKDDLPDLHFRQVSADLCHRVSPGEEKAFSYVLIPSKRGSYRFNHIYVRCDGILGFSRRYFKLYQPKEYKVYPDLTNIGKYRLIVQNHRLLSQGNRRVYERGLGSEFESLREYVEGDDYRKINWKATARENKLIINLYEAEKNQPVYVLLDTGRTMSYSIRGYKKLDYAINASLILSDIVNQKGDNSGLMVFNTDVLAMIPPGKGDVHRNNLMEALYHAQDTNNASDYEGAFYELVYKQKRRSIVFIFTDFETEEDVKELLRSIPIIAKRHVPVIVLMVNESLLKITAGGSKSIKAIYEQGVAEDFLAARQRIIRSLNQNGVICIETAAEHFAIDTVNQYLHLREKFYR